MQVRRQKQEIKLSSLEENGGAHFCTQGKRPTKSSRRELQITSVCEERASAHRSARRFSSPYCAGRAPRTPHCARGELTDLRGESFSSPVFVERAPAHLGQRGERFSSTVCEERAPAQWSERRELQLTSVCEERAPAHLGLRGESSRSPGSDYLSRQSSLTSPLPARL
ncbi:unnamed protein product [Arctogadus glacialis]